MKTITQTLIRKVEKKYSVVFESAPGTTPENTITTGVYVMKTALAQLGDPPKLIMSIQVPE